MDKKTFGAFLRQKREASGKDVEEYANQLEVEPITLRRWENGLYLPRNHDRYTKVAKVYGLSKAEMLEYTGISISDTVEGAEKDTDLLPLIKEIAKTTLDKLNQHDLNYLIRVFCKAEVRLGSEEIDVLMTFKL